MNMPISVTFNFVHAPSNCGKDWLEMKDTKRGQCIGLFAIECTELVQFGPVL